MNPLNLYEEAVKNRIKTENGYYFPSDTPERAAIVLNTFLRETKRDAKLFFHSLDDNDVYSRVGVELANAIKRGVCLKIITVSQSKSGALADRLMKIASDCGGCVEIRKLNKTTDICDFALFDKIMFRLEISQKSREALTCACASNDDAKERLELMEEAFDYLWSESVYPCHPAPHLIPSP